jgi:hypothetical protein
MRVEKYVYINGSRNKQLEIVDFLDDDEYVGFGNMYTKALRKKIEYIRANVRYHCTSENMQ